jgi:hypothetical protein
MTPENLHLLDLRTSGFKPLKPGRIHVRCPVCGRKLSNMARGEDDPSSAVLAETWCPRCVGSDYDSGTDFFDADGGRVW